MSYPPSRHRGQTHERQSQAAVVPPSQCVWAIRVTDDMCLVASLAGNELEHGVDRDLRLRLGRDEGGVIHPDEGAIGPMGTASSSSSSFTRTRGQSPPTVVAKNHWMHLVHRRRERRSRWLPWLISALWECSPRGCTTSTTGRSTLPVHSASRLRSDVTRLPLREDRRR